jgi:hypothetical protein
VCGSVDNAEAMSQCNSRLYSIPFNAVHGNSTTSWRSQRETNHRIRERSVCIWSGSSSPASIVQVDYIIDHEELTDTTLKLDGGAIYLLKDGKITTVWILKQVKARIEIGRYPDQSGDIRWRMISRRSRLDIVPGTVRDRPKLIRTGRVQVDNSQRQALTS